MQDICFNSTLHNIEITLDVWQEKHFVNLLKADYNNNN